jgi:integrase
VEVLFMATKSTRSRRSSKPKKPRADFPLFPHASGRWAKKVRQRFCYFGKVADDPKGEKALEQWLDQKDDLLAGRTPRVKGDGLTIKALGDLYLTHKSLRRDSHEITARTYRDCKTAMDRIVATFGRGRLVDDLTAGDFETLRAELAKTLGPLALGIEIQRIRSVFKFAHDNGLIDRPVRYGQAFAKPSRRMLRQTRQQRGSLMLEPEALRKIIDAAPATLRAMVLLGLNAALGNRDVAMLPLSALDLDGGWLDYPRAKTAIERRVPLWPETVAALRIVIDNRREPHNPEFAQLVFLTRQRECFVKHSKATKGAWTDSVGLAFGKLLRAHDLKRPGLNFYSLRHCFRTVADESKDQPAVDHIMGHAADASDMAAVYRERIGDTRLRAVVDTVHNWLYGNGGAA